ncbi:MAG: NAD(P)H-hydrate dehydratase [Thermodesulfovibrionales bacterium]|nr:NAD(P)H-hydrate dehydratase [Thermodesulfovibrionales bacterium]
MKIVTAQEMREIDRITIDDYGIPSVVLMERAGLAVALKIRELFPPKKVVVLSGRGNNGGDGLVVARILKNWGYRSKVIIIASEDELSKDCAIQYRIAKRFNIEISFTSSVTYSDLHSAIVVDAIFGTGLNKEVGDTFIRIFRQIKSSGCPVVSVDVPSGVSSDTGQIMGDAVKADITVTFGLPKLGHYLFPGALYRGRLFVEDIGFDIKLINHENLKKNLIEKSFISSFLTPRDNYSHKGNYGHILVVAGSKGKTGAALLCSKAALRSGSGLVTIAIPKGISEIIQSRVTEEMTLIVEDSGKGEFSAKALPQIVSFLSEKIDALAIGPGIGVSTDTQEIVRQIVKSCPIPIVIDADGINSLCFDPDTLNNSKASVVLTPHPGEMMRLWNSSFKTNLTIKDIEKNRIEIATKFAKEYNVVLVLKGVPTVVASPKGDIYINTTGNPGMATAGSGDVLTGIITSLIGQRLSPINAAICGVYLHGLAGDIAADKITQQSMLASDIINCLSSAFSDVSDGFYK